MVRWSAWGAALVVLLHAWPLAAQGSLLLTRAEPGQIRVDGDVGEWRGIRWQELGDSDDASMEHALAYDRESLYLAARVWDDALVRSSHPGERDDALVLALALPAPSGKMQTTEIWLFPGVVGRQASVAELGPPGATKPAKSVQVVEGPIDGDRGYVIEARIPLKVLPGGRDWMLGRGALRLRDVDKPNTKPERVLATAGRDSRTPGSYPPLLAEGGPNATLADFLRRKSVANVRHDLLGNVTGDARLERVAVTGTFAVVVGPGIEDGRGYHFVDLPVTTSAGVRAASLRDLTGDGQDELVVSLHQTNDLGSRDVVYVMQLGTPPAKAIFGIEVRKETSDGHVASELVIGRGGRPTLEASIGRADGLGPDNFDESRASGVEGILLPWGPVKRRVYRWDGERFAVEKEEPNEKAVEARAAKPRTSAPAADAHTRIESHPEPPSAADLVAAFRREQGVPPQVRPHFVTHANLAEDRRHETLMLLDTHLLVIGEGFLSGTGWFWFGLPVGSGADVQRVFTADVTGDGRREVFVRFRQRVGDVQREILIGYTFAAGSFRRILGVEVRRAQGGESVGNVVKVVPAKGHWAIRILPGGATGWDAERYPFVSEQTDEWEPVRLPWVHRPASYRYDGTSLVASR